VIRTVGQVGKLGVLARLGGACTIAGALVAGIVFPAAGGVGLLSNAVSDSVNGVSTQLQAGQVPQMSTMVDAAGKPLAYFYDQRRTQVAASQISQAMKLAIVSVEDKRFYDNTGVDWRGTLRAALTNVGGGSTQGASTLTQQYVKNYELLVLARTPAQQQAATANTVARKVRDVRIALSLNQQLSKDEILARYLNLVPFGNGAYGVQQAAQTYFGVDAAALTVPQSAMLAGMVRSSSALNPYLHPTSVLTRRNVVLDTMQANGVLTAADNTAAKATPLAVLSQPNIPTNGCIGAGDSGFFCDYALQYLQNSGLSRDQINRGGYTIKTTIDPAVQAATRASVTRQAPATLPGIANVMNVISPGSTAHPVLAMASSRTYGLDAAAQQTVLGQPYTTEGDGAGSVFKIFTTAAAMTQGLGINDTLTTPQTLQLKGFGSSQGVNGCPKDTYCVHNYDPNYKLSYSVTDALAQSPNTAFVKLISQVGVGPTVDMAVKLGLRSYAAPGSSGIPRLSLADQIKNQNQASFTLGATPVNPLELANVGATLASGGTWCPPTPINTVTDSTGAAVALQQQGCEQVVDPNLAHTLAVGLSKDAINGTATGAAKTVGWTLPVSSKTGTTDREFSDAFLGFTNTLAAADMIYDDSSTPQSMCTSPLRHCPTPQANLTGGAEPGRTFFGALAPVIDRFGPVVLPATTPRYLTGTGAFGK